MPGHKELLENDKADLLVRKEKTPIGPRLKCGISYQDVKWMPIEQINKEWLKILDLSSPEYS